MISLWTRAGLSWRQLGLRLWRQIWEDELLGRCAELAYFFLFSVFPLLLFLTTLLGYVAEANPRFQVNLFRYVARISPSRDVTELLNHTLEEIRSARTGAKLYLSLGTAVWVASNGMLAAARTLNTACGLKETRRWWRKRIMAIVLTLAFTALIVCALAMIFYGAEIGEAMAEPMGAGVYFAALWYSVLRWLLLLLFVVLSFEIVYNYAPNIPAHERSWGSPGAVTGVFLWLLASYGLRMYLVYFRSYTTAYGSLGAVILLLVWFYLTAFAILMGGEVNSEIVRELALLRGEPRPRLSRQRKLLKKIKRLRRRKKGQGT